MFSRNTPPIAGLLLVVLFVLAVTGCSNGY
jgi:hypothetical protein